MKSILFYSALLTGSLFQLSAQNISTIRTQAPGNVVTVYGKVTNGAELGIIRYLQDNTGGIAAYGATLSTIQRYDSVAITGTLKQFNNLLELDPIAGYTIFASNKPAATPSVITPSQMDETVEGTLIRINNVSFGSASGGVFPSTATNYTVTSNGQSFAVRSNTFLSGTPIPSGTVNLVGLASQYCPSPSSGCITGYQMLIRNNNDIIVGTTTSLIDKKPILISVYPNPADQYVSIVSDDNASINGIELINLLGETVMQISGPVKTFSSSLLNNGVYFLRISTNEGIRTERLVISH